MRTPLLSALLIAVLGTAAVADGPADPQALASAQSWLALTDAGHYAESWRSSAAYFQSAITAEKWSDALTAVRAPLGEVVSRKLRSATTTHSLPGAPDGTYVVIQFDTVFANKKSAVETITPMLEKGGHWRVSGYFIK